jgi:hypothetical protein
MTILYTTVNGHTYSTGTTDEGIGVRFLDNGGHWDNFIPLVNDIITATSGANYMGQVFLGAKATAPTVDNFGNPLIIGARYILISTFTEYVWNGTDWVTYTPADVELAALAGLTSAVDKVPHFTGSGTAALATATAYMRGLWASASLSALLTSLGLQNVNNTSDAVKPVSTATQTALNLKANLSAPVLSYATSAAVGSGSYNTMFGPTSSALTTGSYNTMVGTFAGNTVTSGSQNTFLGATNTITIGNNNLLLGFNAAPTSATVSNEATLGSGITVLRCGVTSITSTSDSRDKEEIVDCIYGLDFVNDLRPVSYKWAKRDGTLKGLYGVNFIAQELEEVQQKYAAGKYLRLVLKENPEYLEATPSNLIPVLVKAIQELTAKVAELEARL